MTNRENAAHKLLRILGANGGYLGFYYTATAIEIVMDSGKTIYQCKWLYNEVAERYHTTPFCVERNIRTMVDMIWNYGNRQFLKELVPYPFNAKPKNAQFIDGLVAYMAEQKKNKAVSSGRPESRTGDSGLFLPC